MGSAEYEWGDVPRAFTALHVFEKDGKLAQNEVETDHEKVYYICHADDQKEVEKVLKKLAAGELLRNMKGGYRTRDGVWLHEALLNKAHEPFDVAGGVCIGDSPFLYVVDVAMLEKLRRLFQKS